MPCRIPPYIVHQKMLDFDASVQMPYHIADYQIDKLIWPLVKGNEIIGLVDTGISQTHLNGGQLQGQVLHAQDFTNSQYGPYDANGHGSHTAGIMVAKDFGLARTCAKLVSAKCLGDDGSGSDESIANGIDYCVEQGATLINLSLGSDFPSPTIDAAVQRAMAEGVWLVFAAGNSSGPVEYPAKNFGGISAIGRDKSLASFSCFGAEVYATAPGVQITSLSRGGGYAVLSGTSMAAPWITGFLACKRAYDRQRGFSPPKSKDEWLGWLPTDCDDLGVAGRDARFGFGVPSASKFVQADAPAPAPQPPSPPTPTIPPATAPRLGYSTDGGKTWWQCPPGTAYVPLKVS